jgi:hypothetical protein
MRITLLVVLFSLILCGPVCGSDSETEEDNGPGITHRIVTYIPNRILDVFDLVRLRVRVGPGIAVGIRATEAADFFFGTYFTVYAGLPGPRNGHIPKLPVGVETKTGVEVSLADVTTEAVLMGPDYSNTEFGFGFQALILGLDFGVDPFEFVDLVAGLFTLDLKDDDF